MRVFTIALILIGSAASVDAKGGAVLPKPAATTGRAVVAQRGKKKKQQTTTTPSLTTFSPWIKAKHEGERGAKISSPALVSQGQEEEQHHVISKGRLQLLFVSFLYGTLSVTLRRVNALKDPPSLSTLSFVRGWFTVLCFVPMLLPSKIVISPRSAVPASQEKKEHHSNNYSKRGLWLAAFEMAVWNCASYSFIVSGLWRSQSSARVSLLTQTSVILTPLLSSLMGHEVRNTVWMACAVALGGLVTLATSGGSGLALAFSQGDLLVLCGALCWSLFLIRMTKIGPLYPKMTMQALTSTMRAVLYTGWFVAEAFWLWHRGALATSSSSLSFLDAAQQLWLGWRDPYAYLLLFYSALGPGAIAGILQQQAQQIVSAAEANVLLSIEPVFTGMLAFLILGETITSREISGGSLILLAALLASGSLDRVFRIKK